jgi:pyruvyltransferase
VHWYWYDRERNFGDGLTPFLLERLFGVTPEHAGVHVRVDELCFGVGSILHHRHLSMSRAVIWGSGFMFPYFEMERPRDVACVRGPLSACLLRRQGIACPERYADPAVLVGRLFNGGQPAPECKIGVVPHYADHATAERMFRGADPDEVRVIDVRREPEAVLLDVARCETVLSSSLHGCVAADALGRRNTWCAFSHNVIGMGFKFFDYYASLGRTKVQAVFLDGADRLAQAARQAVAHDVSAAQEAALAACPAA